MIARFCLYSIFKNLRFFEPFFVLYLLFEANAGGVGFDYFQVGALIGYQKLITGLLEIPSGVATDRWGRRSALAICFGCYVIAFPLYAISATSEAGQQILLLYIGQSFFGIGEALRTGSHKAIMLDWLDETGQSNQTTRVIGLTRFFSKTSAGLSALLGGVLVFVTGTFVWLFWASTIPAVLGVILMLGYPDWLEGEMVRDSNSKVGWRDQFRRLWVTPGLFFLMVQSILFESQVKLAQIYLQPFLKESFRAKEVTIVGGVGAILVGVYYFVQDTLSASASALAVPLERRVGDGFRAIQIIYGVNLAVCLVVGLCLQLEWIVIGLFGFVVLAVLQNARRPIFVSQFNRVMDKPQRATTLSIESQGRTFMVALLAPLTGLVADRHGLAAVFLVIGIVLIAGTALRFVFSRPLNS